MRNFCRFASTALCVAMGVGMWAQIPAQDSIVNIVSSIESSGVIFVEQPESLNKRISHKPVASMPIAGTSERNGQDADKPTEISSSTNDSDAHSATGTYKSAGYRVQVFSDNNVRTAKSEARAKAQALQERLPHYRTYVVYQSPYWRLKVGDFPTLSEAENAADEIKKLFPSYAREVRVVKDRINRQ